MLREIELKFDPVSALRSLHSLSGACLLHSGVQANGLGRFSILAASPWKTFTFNEGVAEIVENGSRRIGPGEAFQALSAELDSRHVIDESFSPFCNGAIGYIAYEAARHLEKLPSAEAEKAGPDMRFHFYKGAILFDHQTQRVYAVNEVDDLLDALRVDETDESVAFRLLENLESNVSKRRYLDAVGKVKEFIREGDVYQVNLSHRFSASYEGDPMELYARLAAINPAPYSAYIDFGDEQILSSSPEQFLKYDGCRIETRPIKGTRPLGESSDEIAANERDLASSEKDRAELLMIVDLERNDLGRVCKPNTIEVKDLFALERYATVIHQTARVSGELEEGLDIVDAIRAMFPGGSISGAPKIRSMEVIQELEDCERGVYTGAIGMIDASGKADFNIAIRTMRLSKGRLSFSVGGGIVWDSDPESEYEETLLKAKAMMAALEGVGDE